MVAAKKWSDIGYSLVKLLRRLPRDYVIKTIVLLKWTTLFNIEFIKLFYLLYLKILLLYFLDPHIYYMRQKCTCSFPDTTSAKALCHIEILLFKKKTFIPSVFEKHILYLFLCHRHLAKQFVLWKNVHFRSLIVIPDAYLGKEGVQNLPPIANRMCYFDMRCILS